jgi:gliding motility-associated-like protein
VYCAGDTLGYVHKYPLNPVSNSYQWYQNGNLLPGANDTILYIVDPENTYNQYTTTFMLYGCKHYATRYIYEKPPPLFIPEHTVNVFSPNGDNVNEFFHPFRIDPSYNNPIGGTNLEQKAIDYYADEYSLIIFDRWGKKIYESSDYAEAWDGKLKSGRKADDGTYFYVATYRSRCGDDADKVTKQGFIHLLK